MMKTLPAVLLFSAVSFLAPATLLSAQPSPARCNVSTKDFRLSGGNVTYAFGVNACGELQQVYWGGRLADTDKLPPAHRNREMASFDTPYTTTPQEYAGWGQGLMV